MKRFFLYLMVGASLFATSCGAFGGGNNDKTAYQKVYNGIKMYNEVEVTNNYAMDGVNIAMRLSLLLNEMETVGIQFEEGKEAAEPDWSLLGSVKVSGLEYNKRVFLFGNSSDVEIWREGDDYYINYGPNGQHTSGYKDTAYRIARYCIRTSGSSDIMESSASTPWRVELDSQIATYAEKKRNTDAFYECKGWDIELWSTEPGELEYVVNDMEIYTIEEDEEDEEKKVSEADKEYSNWMCSGKIWIPNYTAFTIEDTIGEEFCVDVTMAGGKSLSLDTYEYYTSSPISYNYLSGANIKFGGEEQVRMVEGALRDKKVRVETSSDGLHTVHYDDESYIYDAEYLYIVNYDKLQSQEDQKEEDYLDKLEDEE